MSSTYHNRFLSQTSSLASRADDITQEQIDRDASNKIRNITSQQLIAGFEGLGSAASNFASAGLGGGGPEAIDFSGTANAAKK